MLRLAHQELAAVLAGDPIPMTIESDGMIEADLTPIYAEAQAQLRDAGITVLEDVYPPPNQLTIALFPSRDIEDLRRYVRWLDRAAFWLPVAATIAAGLFLLLSPHRWRATIWLSVALVVGALLVWLVVRLGREITSDRISEESA